MNLPTADWNIVGYTVIPLSDIQKRCYIYVYIYMTWTVVSDQFVRLNQLMTIFATILPWPEITHLKYSLLNFMAR